MSNNRPAYFRIGLLLGLGFGGALLALMGWESIERYQPPPALHADFPGGDPLSGRLILIVLDGIRLDVVPRMEFLSSLARWGSSGTTTTVQPSLSLPARASMVTGARPEIHGVTSNGRIFKTVGDSVFSLGNQAGLPVAAAGWRFWAESLGDAFGDNVFIYRDKPEDTAPLKEIFAWQQDRCRQAVGFLRHWDRGLMVISVVTPDIIGHRYGGRSPQYVETAVDADRCIRHIVDSTDNGNTTFIITSDHGHIDRRGRGGHGGQEPEVVNVPTVLFGRSVKHGSGWHARQIDIAPTICALMGLPMPASNQGRIIWDAVDVPSSVREDLLRREVQQRAFAQAKLPDTPAERRQERRSRLPEVLAITTLLGALLVWTGRRMWRDWFPVGMGIAAYYLTYHLLFWVSGLAYSLSAIGQEGAQWSFVGRNFAAAALAIIVASCTFKFVTKRPLHEFVLDLAILISATIALQVCVIQLRFGLFMVRFVPDLPFVLKAYLDLTQLSAIGLTASVLFASAARPAKSEFLLRRQSDQLRALSS